MSAHFAAPTSADDENSVFAKEFAKPFDKLSCVVG
jgi:hypothetical protein